AAYDQQAAAYNTQRKQVDAQTARLRDAAGYGTDSNGADPGNNGAGAACSTSGAFGECSTAAIDPATGQTLQDQNLCLLGVSACGASSTAADRTASASCDVVTGCATNSKAGAVLAQTTCGVGDCNTSGVADLRGADTVCQARAGCTENGTTPTTPDAADLAAGKTDGISQSHGACAKDCALVGFATRADAGTDCQTSNGTCDTDSTGRRATETKPAPANETAAQAAQRAAQTSKDNGEATSKAHCQANSIGCDTTTTVKAGVDEATGKRGWLTELLFGPGQEPGTRSQRSGQPSAQAAIHCARGATDCSGNAATNTAGKTENSTTTPEKPAVATNINTDPATGQAATPATPAKTSTDNRTRSGAASCQVTGGECTSSSGSSQDDGTLGYTDVNCDQAAGCQGKGTTATNAEITAGTDGKTATRKTDAHHECTVGATTGGCSTDSSSTVTNNAVTNNSNPDIELAATGTQQPKTDPAQGLTAASKTTATVDCGSADCKGAQQGATSGTASGDVKDRASKGATGCDVHGIGGTCGSVTTTEVTFRGEQTGPDGKPQPAGVVSVSHAASQVRCQDSAECGGKAHTDTAALDTAVSKDWRGASTDADCTVRGGGCQGQAASDASTTTDYVKTDPKTGQPLKGQPGSGPTATSRAAASVDCQNVNCSGTAHTASAAFDGAVAGGKPRVSEGKVACEAGANSCQVQTLSNATTGPGAAATYGDQVNADRLPDGPSAASTTGGKLTGTGGGTITAEVTATDPTVSDAARGNRAEGSCSGTTGGTCTAVVNAAASSGPDANSIAPMVADQPTQNATTTNTPIGDNGSGDGQNGTQNGQNGTTGKAAKTATASPQNPDQPGQGGQQPNQPATAPGSSASSGGPTVPGASSWSSAWASLNCDATAGACKGTPRSSATGLAPDGHDTSGTGNKGPPAANTQATGTTAATCDTTGGACQATSASTAGSGQVVADIFTAQNKNQAQQAQQQADQAKQAAEQAKQAAAAPGATAEQRTAAEQATKTADDAAKTAADADKAAKTPLAAKDLPASWSTSSASAHCAGPGCNASSTADSSGAPGTAHTDATCTAGQSGCTTSSDVTVTLMPDSGSAEVGSNVVCPEAGCTGKVTGKANAAAGQGEHRTSSDGTGDTACDGKTACQAGVRATVATATTAPTVAKDKQSATTTVNIAASCDNGGTGCPIHAASHSDSVGSKNVHATTATTCAGNAGCTVSSSGSASPEMAQVSFQCGGAEGCTGHSEGNADAGKAKGNATADCSPSKNGQCTGGVQVGASADGSALAGATCQGTEGTNCRYHFEASASDSSRAGKNWAKASAHGSEDGSNGGGMVQVMAKTMAAPGQAQASASCTGAKNCASPYSAHAEAHDRKNQTANAKQPDMPSGHWDANGAGTCSGNGKGGCGVQAWAQAGPGGSGGAKCTGDCSNFKVEQAGNSFTKTGPSFNEIKAAEAARAARAAHNVVDIKEWMDGRKDGVGADGLKKVDGVYKLYTRDPTTGEVKESDCTTCAPGQSFQSGGTKLTITQDGNVQATRAVPGGKDEHLCNATVGCALSGDNKGTGNGEYWIAGNGKVHDGITGSDLHYKDSRPSWSTSPNLNEGNFGNTKGGRFGFTCNGGCEGTLSNVDLGKGKFTDKIDLAGTPNQMTGRDGLGNLGNLAHSGKGTITLEGRDHKPMDPIQSDVKHGLSGNQWAQVANKYGYNQWDYDTLKNVLGKGDTATGTESDGHGGYFKYWKTPDGQLTKAPCPECTKGGQPVQGGGDGTISIAGNGDATVTQTTAPGKEKSTCTSNTGCLLAGGESGGYYWMQGKGNVHDGATGSNMGFQDSRPTGSKDPNYNSGRLGGNGGSPFSYTCNGGCTGDVGNVDLGKGKFTDHVDLAGSARPMFGRDGYANPGDYSHTGKGVVTLQVGQDRKDVITSDGNGLTPGDTWTTITTRGPNSAGHYDMGGGQTGEIMLAEGYGIRQ
ncbi:hypothetical protein, partial [Pseudonocardia acaciae]|uniref:hypothetical protein n=1 Tax=Pseudonocardia acaciae TaxID=551276 RepID=UPI00055A0569